jgi:cobalt-zinc-cadmium resistance protein CzcA
VRSGLSRQDRQVIGRRAAEVSQSIFFAAAIIIAGFVPLFTLSGIEGHIFGPMAKTYAYAIAGGLIATFTIAPALSRCCCFRRTSRSARPGGAGLRRSMSRRWSSCSRIASSPFAASALLDGHGGFFAVRSLGLEFLPKLEEGNLWIRATLPQSISLEDSEPT